jgi:hypothetical protein
VGRDDVALSLAWFPANQFAEALERWPDLAEDWETTDHAGYCRYFQGQLLVLEDIGVRHLSVAPLVIDDFIAWCGEEELDPATGEARAGYATELSRADRVIRWPPARNAPCWCGSGRKYKTCCGTVETPDVPPELLTTEVSGCCSVVVELRSGRGETLDPPPGRVLLVGPTHTFGDLARAIDQAFARWDLSHLHEFRLEDGTRIGMLDLEDDDELIDEEDMLVAEALGVGEWFVYEYDFGDRWIHRCRLEAEDVLADDDIAFDLEVPIPIYGWGAIPDQYGRTTDDREV